MVKEKNIFLIGIKGVAMANLARILKRMRKKVTGSDLKDEFITENLLKQEKINYQIGFDEKHLSKEIDLIVYSAAHGGLDNPQVKFGKENGIKVISQAELIGKILKDFKNTIGICGSHGKTTTSSLLTYSLIKLRQKPSYLVGCPFFDGYPGGDFQSTDYFVVEADEYGVAPPHDKTPKFYFLPVNWAIATNIDFDHPDVFTDLNAVKQSFYHFFQDKNLILNFDNQLLKEFYSIKKREKQLKKIFSYGFSKEADFQVTDWQVFNQYTEFTLRNNLSNKKIGNFKISLFGKHNILNAVAVISLLLTFGFSYSEIKEAIKEFKGAKRRLELILEKDKFILLDDYAHHPAEIAATIEAARLRYPEKKILVIFQPHTFSRTKKLFFNFISALSLADQSIVLDIFPSARENKDHFSISSLMLVEEAKKRGIANLLYLKNEQLKDFFHPLIKENLVVITMGAGDVYKVKEIFYNFLEQNENQNSKKY